MSTEPIVEEAAGLCVNEHGGAIGMPQLCGEWIPNQIFWLLVTLVVIYFVLTKIALPRIAAVLADRKGTITNDLAAAEELKQKAVAAEKAYNDALANARTEAAKIVAGGVVAVIGKFDARAALDRAPLALDRACAHPRRRQHQLLQLTPRLLVKQLLISHRFCLPTARRDAIYRVRFLLPY